MDITKELKNSKSELLRYFRSRAEEEFGILSSEYAANQFKEKTRAMNRFLQESRDNIISSVESVAHAEHWDTTSLLECILIVTYTNNVVMLETRNSIWAYDYMAFSRRIGELWEPFCKLCFKYPLNQLSLFVPPLFADVKQDLTDEIKSYIAHLNITPKEKTQLNVYYDKVWGLVTSGEVKLECDLHFISGDKKYVIDFKSGFGSNEKGNTNRLLLVGAIYKNISDSYKCMIFVRSTDNNHYLKTLESSGMWETSQGMETYKNIQAFTGYNLHNWIHTNISWMDDFSPAMREHVTNNNLDNYLIW